MGFKAEIILDSVSIAGPRLITMELTYPRFIHAEFMTHRMFSRNAASSRAIPTRKMIDMVLNDPAMPVYWGKNKRGMAAKEEIKEVELAKKMWLKARDEAVHHAHCLKNLNAHKQIVNRIIEPWKNITVICTATEWDNFYGLRRHEDAQPEIHHLANMMFEARENSRPVQRIWHLPYVQEDEEDVPLDVKKNISVARCARVSYLTHDGKRNIDKDLTLHERLLTGSGHGHWSQFVYVELAARNQEQR